MSETQTDTFEHGIGITTLASDRGAVDDIRENSPVAIHGVLIPENTVLRGGQGVEHFYTSEMAERAAGVLRQQIKDGRTVHLVKNFHETEGQAPADDIIGEVTSAGYSPGIGVVFEAETTDIETANKIKNGYLEISPSIARGLGEFDETMQARTVTEVAGFRDVAVVGTGQPGVDVDIGPNPAVEALSMDALHRAFDTLQRDRARTPVYSGTEESEWSGPDLEDFVAGYDAISDDVNSVDDLTDEERTLIASKTLLGDPDGETYRELAFFPVVNPSTDNLNRRALVAVRGGRGSQADIPDDARASAQRMAGELLNDEFGADVEVNQGDDGRDAQSTDGPAGGEAPTDQTIQSDNMSNELTDDEQALLAAVEDPSEAIDVLRDYSSREEPRIIDASNYETIEPDELDTLRENVRQAKEAFAALLAEDSPLSVDALARSDMDALTEPFRDDEGQIDIDTLRQTPETGEVDASDATEGDDGDAGPVKVDALSVDEHRNLNLLKKKRDRFLNTDMDKRAGEIEQEIVDTLGAESFEDVAAELEAL